MNIAHFIFHHWSEHKHSIFINFILFRIHRFLRGKFPLHIIWCYWTIFEKSQLWWIQIRNEIVVGIVRIKSTNQVANFFDCFETVGSAVQGLTRRIKRKIKSSMDSKWKNKMRCFICEVDWNCEYIGRVAKTHWLAEHWQSIKDRCSCCVWASSLVDNSIIILW